MEEKEFKTVKIGETFFIKTEDYNRISQCVKRDDLLGEEIFGGLFPLAESDLVIVEV